MGLTTEGVRRVSGDLQLAWMLLVHMTLTAAPAVASALLAMRSGVRSVTLLLAMALAGSGVGAMLDFWSFYADPTIGRAMAFVLVLGSAAAVAWACRGGLDRQVLRALAVPAGLWVFACIFIVYLGFLHGGQDQPLAMSALRFSHPLPPDNDLPRYFSDWFYAHGHDGPAPPYGDWLSSDRPPLQIGYILAERPFSWDTAGLRYELLGVVAQQLWVLGMWAVLRAARIHPAARGLAMLAAMVSDVAILHGFYVWPKLLAATFALAALAIVISPSWSQWRRNAFVAALFAVLCGLAMLSHGASAFFLLPLIVIALFRGVPSRRWLAVAAVAGALTLGPWSAYQHYADPPGDRLLKWQLGGVLAVNDDGTLETIVDGYRRAGVDGTISNKVANLRMIVGIDQARAGWDSATRSLDEGSLSGAVTAVRSPRFFSLFLALGLFLLAPVAMAFRRVRGSPGGPEWRFAVAMLAFCALVTLVWALLMFGGADATSVHVGSLAVPLLAIAAAAVGLYAVSRRLAIAAVALNALTVLVLYVPSLTPVAGTSYSPVAAVVAALSLVAFAFLCLRGERAPVLVRGTDEGLRVEADAS